MGWVLDGIFTHGAPLKIHQILITREWGERGHHILDMALDNDMFKPVYDKWLEKMEFEKLILFEWRNPGDGDYNSVIKPKYLVIWKPWIPTMREFSQHIKRPILSVAFKKTAQNKPVIDVLKGFGYEHAGYGGDFSL